SFASEFHHVRLQTPDPPSDQGNERSKRASRPTISACAEPHASYDRQKIRNGIVSERVQASNGLTATRVIRSLHDNAKPIRFAPFAPGVDWVCPQFRKATQRLPQSARIGSASRSLLSRQKALRSHDTKTWSRGLEHPTSFSKRYDGGRVRSAGLSARRLFQSGECAGW